MSARRAAMEATRESILDTAVELFRPRWYDEVTLADRSSDLLVRHVDRLRTVYRLVQQRYPFETIAVCVLPDHLHAVWSLPEGDSNSRCAGASSRAAFPAS